ncbi:MAG: DMT family transporter [bacterium]|nr:DMT family transporter [bacterium]
MKTGLIALMVAGLIGGISPILVKIGVKEIPPLTLTAIRFLLATLIFLPFFLKFRTKNLSRRDIENISFISIFFALNVGIFSIAIQFTTAIVSQIFYTLVPIIVVALSYFILKERITKNKIIGLMLAFTGVAFLLQQSIAKEEVLTFGTPLGNLLNIAAVISWSFYMIYSKRLTNKYSPATTTFFSFLITTVLLLLILPIEFTIRPLIINSVTFSSVASVLGLAFFSSCLMFFLIQLVIKKTSPFTASLFQYLGPFSAAIFAIPILGEKPTFPLILAGFLIILGVFYATTFNKKK